MGKYVSYGNRVNEIAKKAFLKYQDAEARFQKAKSEFDRYPKRNGPLVTPEYTAKSARAEADFITARQELIAAKSELENKNDDVAKIRKELASQLASDYAAKPDNVDTSTVELLKTGILDADEYLRLMNKAKSDGNLTMSRVIAKYAEKQAAELLKSNDGEETAAVRDLRTVSMMAPKSVGETELRQFDVMGEAFRRTSENPAMIQDWDDLTRNSRENL